MQFTVQGEFASVYAQQVRDFSALMGFLEVPVDECPL